MINLWNLKVEDACSLEEDRLFLVRPEEDFNLVVLRFANYSELRGIFVTDDQKCLVGVITRSDLLDWARVQLGAALAVPLGEREKRIRLVSLITASTAGQVLRPESHRAGVKKTDALAHALNTMIKLDLIVLPVVDDSGCVIGDLRLSELLRKVAQQSEHQEN